MKTSIVLMKKDPKTNEVHPIAIIESDTKQFKINQMYDQLSELLAKGYILYIEYVMHIDC